MVMRGSMVAVINPEKANIVQHQPEGKLEEEEWGSFVPPNTALPVHLFAFKTGSSMYPRLATNPQSSFIKPDCNDKLVLPCLASQQHL